MSDGKRTDYWREYARARAAERRAFNAAQVVPREKSSSKQPDYVRLAEEIVAPGKCEAELTADERARAVRLAIDILKERGIWPESDPRQLEAQRRKKKRAA